MEQPILGSYLLTYVTLLRINTCGHKILVEGIMEIHSTNSTVLQFFHDYENRTDGGQSFVSFIDNYNLSTAGWLELCHAAKRNDMRTLRTRAFAKADKNAKTLDEHIAVAEFMSRGANQNTILTRIYSFPLNTKEEIRKLRESSLQALQHVAKCLEVRLNLDSATSQ